MGFGEAISSGFKNYVNFTGRAPRSEYWFWILFYVIVSVVTLVIDLALIRNSGVSPLNTLASLALFLPTLAVAVRRLHDIDRTGWWVLIGLIPIVGWVILLIWYCNAGTPGTNRFGADPLGKTP
jgi:uncharacterized membrane protein YhaH (DUF805 family)